MTIAKFFLLSLKKLRLLEHLSLYPKTVLNNHKFVIPIINEVGFNNCVGLSEPWMQYVLNKLLIDGNKTFVDVGVNLGQTLLKVKAANSQVYYIGFEPNPFCVNYVNQLISVNNFSNTDIFPVGLSSKTTVLKLNLYSNSNLDSAASIIEGFRGQMVIKKTMNVPVFRFEDLGISEEIKLDIVKVDVEGAELEVLEGMYDRILRDRPYVLIEVLPVYFSGNINRVERQAKIKECFDQMNYTIHRVIKTEWDFIRLEILEDFGIHSDLNLCEYVLVPNERVREINNLLSVKQSEASIDEISKDTRQFN